MNGAGRLSLIGLFAMVMGTTTPASATSTLHCLGIDDPLVHVDLTVSNGPVLSVVNAFIATPAGDYAMIPEAGRTTVIVGQGFSTPEGLSVDFADPNLLGVLVTLRTLRADRDRHAAHVGLLIVEDQDVFGLVCDGP